MFNTNPLGDSAMHTPVDISRDASDGLAHQANLSLKDRRRVHDNDLAFRFWIDGKLVNRANKPNQLEFLFIQVKIKCALFGGLCLRVVVVLVPADAR
jgi:hypothetical protein